LVDENETAFRTIGARREAAGPAAPAFLFLADNVYYVNFMKEGRK
jgi:hypothetical protein